MSLLRIRKYGDPVLRLKAKPVGQVDDNLRRLAADMIETMQEAEGIGLAAPQVGKSIRLFVIDMGLIEEGAEPAVFIDPEILAPEGQVKMEEGCLSIPGVTEDVERPEKVKVRYRTLDQKEVEKECDGLLARVFQHEVDHLNGVFFVDRISPMKRRLLEKRLRKIAEEARMESVAA